MHYFGSSTGGCDADVMHLHNTDIIIITIISIVLIIKHCIYIIFMTLQSIGLKGFYSRTLKRPRVAIIGENQVQVIGVIYCSYFLQNPVILNICMLADFHWFSTGDAPSRFPNDRNI